MSGPERNTRLAYLRNVLHPCLALLIPMLFLMLVTELARPLLQMRLSPLAYLFVLLAGLEEVVTGNILFEERIGSAGRVREPLYLLAGVGLVLLPFEQGPLAQRPQALLRPEIVYLGVLVVAQWLMSWRIHNGLRDRELLEGALEGKEGAALQAAIRDNAELASSAMAAGPRVKAMIILFQIVAFAAMLTLFAVGARVAAAATALFVLQALAAVVSVALLNASAEEQLLSAEGVSVSPFYRRRRLLYVLVLLCTALALVLIYARSTSLLPLQMFQPLLDWLAHLFDRTRALPPPSYRSPSSLQPDMDLLRKLQEQSPGPSPLFEILRFLLRVIWQVLKVCLAAVLAYFLIAPLVSRTFRRRLRGLRPLSFAAEQARRLGRALAQILRDMLGWLHRTPGAPPHRRRRRGRPWRGGLRLPRPGLFRLWEMGTVLRAYGRLVRWGQRQGARFSLPTAPREYLARVAALRPEVAAALDEAGVLLEESLYAPRRVGKDKVQRYLRIVKEIVRHS